MPTLYEAHLCHVNHYQSVLSGLENRFLEGWKVSKELETEWENIEAAQCWLSGNFTRNKMIAQICNHFPYVGAYILDTT